MVDYPKTHVTMRYYAPHTIEFGEHVFRTKGVGSLFGPVVAVWTLIRFGVLRLLWTRVRLLSGLSTQQPNILAHTHTVERVKDHLYFLASQAKQRHSPRSTAYEEAAQIVEKYLC